MSSATIAPSDHSPTNGATPPGLRRGYSFADHSTYQPSVPPPGDRLDSEFDNIYRMLTTMHEFCTLLMRPAKITQADLDPKLLVQLNQTARTAVQPDIDRAQATLAYAIAAADRANKEAQRAQQALVSVQNLIRQQAEAQQAQAEERADEIVSTRDAESSAIDAENSANHAALSAAEAENERELAGAWAEYLEGNSPIPDMFFAHTSITGQHWSSRWWAIKAAGAFGMLAELYLGVWPYPPTTTSTGDPIPTGAIYYNSTLSQVFVWDGTQWQPFWAPSKAYTFSLIYRSTSGQTEFPLTTPDLNGEIWTMTPGDPEILEVFVNGVRLVHGNDWTVDNDTSTVTITQPLLLDSWVLIDILVSPNRLAPGRVSTLLLLDFDIDPVTGSPGMIDGTRTLFYLARASDRALVPVSLDTDVQIFIDGAVQKPGLDYSVIDDTITFAEPPLPGATAWGILFSPEVEALIRAGDRAHVVRYRTSRHAQALQPEPSPPKQPEPQPEPQPATRPGEGDPRQVAYERRRRVHTDALIRPKDNAP